MEAKSADKLGEMNHEEPNNGRALSSSSLKSSLVLRNKKLTKSLRSRRLSSLSSKSANLSKQLRRRSQTEQSSLEQTSLTSSPNEVVNLTSSTPQSINCSLPSPKFLCDSSMSDKSEGMIIRTQSFDSTSVSIPVRTRSNDSKRSHSPSSSNFRNSIIYPNFNNDNNSISLETYPNQLSNSSIGKRHCSLHSRIQSFKSKSSPCRMVRSSKGSRVRKVKSQEYKKLRKMVPALKQKNKVSKVVVIEEAIKYIDELHSTLVQRFRAKDVPTIFNGVRLDPKDIHRGNIGELVRKLLANANPGSLPPSRIENVRSLPSFIHKLSKLKK